MLPLLKQEFQKRFQAEPGYIFFCPGRVNLIGEHIDYNGGQVMPCAISYGTWLAVSKNIDKRFRFHCLNFPETADLQVQGSYSKTGKEWFNYPLGVIHQLLEEGHGLSGLDMLYFGNLPIGAGLSSSASVEVLTGFAISSMFGLDIPGKEIAILCKKAENEFIGMNCGIMDQFAVAMGQKNKAILLNCDTLNYEYLPFDTGDYILAVINSNKQRSLTESKYNERFAECGAALKLLRKELNVENLCEISPAILESKLHLVNDPVLENRAKHVVYEQARVKEAVIALRNGNLEKFGELMFASHLSLQELYEVSGKELDAIVEFCEEYNNCIGARMTGAGFGGCAIALVRKENFDDFREKLTADYTSRIGYEPGIFATGAEVGVCQLH